MNRDLPIRKKNIYQRTVREDELECEQNKAKVTGCLIRNEVKRIVGGVAVLAIGYWWEKKL